MAKDVFQEIIIILLTIIALMLVIGLVMYNYVPFTKKIPDQISYTTSSNVKEALQSAGAVDEDKVILTYELDQVDLNNYQRINEYKPGKSNPFSTYTKEVVEGDDTNTAKSSGNGTGSSSGSSSSSSTGSGSGSSGTTYSGGSVDTSTPGSVNPGNYTNNKGLK